MLPALTYAITVLLGAGEGCAVPEGLRDERAGFKPSLSFFYNILTGSRASNRNGQRLALGGILTPLKACGLANVSWAEGRSARERVRGI